MLSNVGNEGAMSDFAIYARLCHRLGESFVIALIHDSHARVDDLGGAAELSDGAAILIHQSGFLGTFGKALIVHFVDTTGPL